MPKKDPYRREDTGTSLAAGGAAAAGGGVYAIRHGKDTQRRARAYQANAKWHHGKAERRYENAQAMYRDRQDTPELRRLTNAMANSEHAGQVFRAQTKTSDAFLARGARTVRGGRGALIAGGAAAAGGAGLFAHGRHKRVSKALAAPWDIVVIEKATPGQLARMAAVGGGRVPKPGVSRAGRKAGVKAAGSAPATTLGQESRAAAVKTVPKQQGTPKWANVKSRQRGVPNWANREARDVGPTLAMDRNGFEGLTRRDLHRANASANKKRGWVIPGSIAVGGGLAGGAAAGAVQVKGKKRVSKGLASTLGKPMKKPGGVLKPVQPPKPMGAPKPATGAKPMTPATGATAPKAPTPVQTLRPPSMLPPKPGAKPVQPR